MPKYLTKEQVQRARQLGDEAPFRMNNDNGLYEAGFIDYEPTMEEAGKRANIVSQLDTESPSNSPILNLLRAKTNLGRPSMPTPPSPAPQIPTVEAATLPEEPGPEQPQQMDQKEMVRKYLQEKFFGQGLDDQAIQGAQEAARGKTFASNLGQAFNTIGQGIAGNVKPDQSFYENLNKQAGQGVTDIQTRRKAGLEELGAQNQQGDVIREMTLRDPNSPQSQAVKQMVQKLYPNQFKDIDLESISAADRDLIYKPIELKEAIEARKQARQENFELRKQALSDKQKLQARPSDKQTDSLNDIDKTLDMLNTIGNNVNNEYIGPVRGNIPDIAVPGKEAQFRAEVGMVEDAYRRLVTGQAASVSEIAILKTRIPKMTDTPENFKAKLEGFKQVTNQIRERTLRNLENQGKDVTNFKASQQALGGTDKVRIQLPDGRTGLIPRQNAQEAVRRGAKLLE